MKRIAILAAALLFAAMPLHLRAQDTNPQVVQTSEHFYQLKLVVEEVNEAGTITNSRSYQTTISTGPKSPSQSIKTGSRIPVATGSFSSGSNSEAMNTQFQYIDLGINARIEHATEIGNDLKFDLRMEVSSMARSETIAGVNEPVIRQNTWDSAVLVPVRKPTVVFSSDDLDSKGKMQVQVTVTPIE
jgi:hypothetical protein